jgi:hypothetical protein
MGVDEAHEHLRVGPISLAKYALAARRTSLTRRSSAFSRASRGFSAAGRCSVDHALAGVRLGLAAGRSR